MHAEEVARVFAVTSVVEIIDREAVDGCLDRSFVSALPLDVKISPNFWGQIVQDLYTLSQVGVHGLQIERGDARARDALGVQQRVIDAPVGAKDDAAAHDNVNNHELIVASSARERDLVKGVVA